MAAGSASSAAVFLDWPLPRRTLPAPAAVAKGDEDAAELPDGRGRATAEYGAGGGGLFLSVPSLSVHRRRDPVAWASSPSRP